MKCEKCNGQGHYYIEISALFPGETMQVDCEDCKGSGEVLNEH